MPADKAYGQLIAINHSTFAEGDYDTSCHALECALARAHFLQDVQGLSTVGTLAREQHAQLETLPLAERAPGTTEHLRRALRLVLASIVAEVPTITSLVQHERDLAARGLSGQGREKGG